jgi:hypothetical protein
MFHKILLEKAYDRRQDHKGLAPNIGLANRVIITILHAAELPRHISHSDHTRKTSCSLRSSGKLPPHEFMKS